MSDRVYIFDTTLRDGEQSPGCSMTVPEKLHMARKLVELGVDILEAGFPIASEGDFEAVDAVSREFPWAQVAALARCCTLDVERAARALAHARRPRIHTFIATSDIHLKYKLKKTPAAGAGRSRGRRGTGPPPRGRRRVLRRGRRPHRSRLPGEDLQGRGRRRRPHGQHPRHRGLLDAQGIRRADRPHRQGAGRLRHRQRALPRRSRPGRRQLAGGHRSRRAADGMHHQRHRRARRQLLARRGRHDPEDPRRIPTRTTPASTPSTCSPPASC